MNPTSNNSSSEVPILDVDESNDDIEWTFEEEEEFLRMLDQDDFS